MLMFFEWHFVVVAEHSSFFLVHDIEQFYELWLKNQKTEKSDEAASHCSKENGKQIHMPTDYAEVTVSTCAEIILLNF